MMTFDVSWDFLKDFYQYSPSTTVRMVNEAIGFYSNKSLRNDSFENFMEDFLSLLPIKASDLSYLDFLNYVMPYEKDAELSAHEDDGEALDILFHENAIINHNWLESFFNKTDFWGSAVMAVGKRIGKSLGSRSRSSWRDILNAVKNYVKFITNVYKYIGFNPLYTPYLILDALGLAEDWYLFGRNSKGFYADENMSFYFRYHRIKSINKWKEKKRKGTIVSNSELSPEQLYPAATLLSVLRREWKFSTDGSYIGYKKDSLNIPPEKLNEALIYGLYREFEHADQAIIQRFDPEVPHVLFHPLVASNIINNGAFEILYIHENLGNSFHPLKNEQYQAVEKRLDNIGKSNGKRLLVDYLFPYTQVRDNDVFLPRPTIIDEIYLSLVKGKYYQQHWRKPKDGEKFEIIQIDPNGDSSLISYQEYMAPGADFLIVKSEKEYELEDSIKGALSDFRHDLKPIRSHLSDEITLLQSYCNAGNILEQKERIDRIKTLNDWLNSYIKMAGEPKTKLKKIQIVDFLRNYTRFAANARNTGTIKYEINDSAIQQKYTILFNEDLLRIILDAIVENAVRHGFSDNDDCPNPTIAFELVDTNSHLLLKVCNNGRPMIIKSAVFKTRGALAGPTGHTGLGGYQINKYVTQMGGRVELPMPTDKKWNTEIHLYLKK